MGIVLQIALLIAGFVLLIKGADFFVGGASSLARRFGIPSLIVGLTIVSIGTSAPELAISISAALSLQSVKQSLLMTNSSLPLQDCAQ